MASRRLGEPDAATLAKVELASALMIEKWKVNNMGKNETQRDVRVGNSTLAVNGLKQMSGRNST